MSKKMTWDEEEISSADDAMSEEEADALIEEAQDDLPEYGDLEEALEGAAEEEASDDTELLKNARLRLEQGRLYEMMLKHDLFEGVEADSRAVKNVQTEIRSFIKERLEILVGIKPDPKTAPKPQSVRVEMPFNELEIKILKQMLSKISDGATQAADKEIKSEQPKGLKSLKVSSAPTLKPVGQKSATKQTAKTQAKPTKKVEEKEEEGLEKSPYEMTAQELRALNEKRKSKYAGRKIEAPNKLPMPDADQQTMMYATRTQQAPPGANMLLNAIVQKIHGTPIQSMETVGTDNTNEGDSRI